MGGQKLDLEREYSVTATEGVVYFLPELGIEIGPVEFVPDMAWTAVNDWISAHGYIEPESSGRIRDVSFKNRR